MSDLLHAAEAGDIEEVRRQLADHADVNWAANEWGTSPLIAASREGLGAIVELLLQHSANVNQATTVDGSTPLIVASCFAHIHIVELLLSHGASVHHINNNGNTCFTYAGDPDINLNPNRMHGILYRLRKWPTTMAILVLQELALYYKIDCSSLIDLHQYIGTELFTIDNEDDYEVDEDVDDDDDDDDGDDI